MGSPSPTAKANGKASTWISAAPSPPQPWVIPRRSNIFRWAPFNASRPCSRVKLIPESTVVCQIRRARAALVEATLEDEDDEGSEETGDSKEAPADGAAAPAAPAEGADDAAK